MEPDRAQTPILASAVGAVDSAEEVRMRIQLCILLLGGLLVLAGCPPAVQVCEPGETQTCVCGGGASGGQVCEVDGQGWDDCDCGSGDDDSGDDDSTSDDDATGDDDSTGDDDTTGDDDATGDDDTTPTVIPFEGMLDITVTYPGVVNSDCQTTLSAEYDLAAGTLEGDASCQLAQLPLDFDLDADVAGTSVTGILLISDTGGGLPFALEAMVTGTYDQGAGTVIGQAYLSWYGVQVQGSFDLTAN